MFPKWMASLLGWRNKDKEEPGMSDNPGSAPAPTNDDPVVLPVVGSAPAPAPDAGAAPPEPTSAPDVTAPPTPEPAAPAVDPTAPRVKHKPAGAQAPPPAPEPAADLRLVTSADDVASEVEEIDIAKAEQEVLQQEAAAPPAVPSTGAAAAIEAARRKRQASEGASQQLVRQLQQELDQERARANAEAEARVSAERERDGFRDESAGAVARCDEIESLLVAERGGHASTAAERDEYMRRLNETDTSLADANARLAKYRESFNAQVEHTRVGNDRIVVLQQQLDALQAENSGLRTANTALAAERDELLDFVQREV